jgi:hypothetical protein
MLHGVHNKNKIKQNSGNSRIPPPHKFKLPFPSSSELATQAAADLTHALLNPTPAGPFCQVGDEQAIALRKLVNIFVSVEPKHANDKLHHDFTSEGGKQRPKSNIPSTHYTITINAKFASKATNTSQTNRHTTNTSWYGARQYKTTKFVPRHDG